MKAFVLHPEAKAELVGAIAYFDGQRDGLGDEFLAEVEKAIDRILDRPASFPRSTEQGHRKCLVKRFPYTLHFLEFEDAVWVMAAAHQRKHPDYWKEREPG